MTQLPETRLQPAARRRSLWAAVLVMLLAAALLIPELAHLSIWEDEGWMIHAVRQSTPDDVMAFVDEDSFPPLYFLALHGWQRVVGDALLLYRMVGVWAILLGVALTYRLALDCFGPRAAITAAVIVSTSDLLLVFAPFTRHYNVYLMLSALCTWIYWRLTRRWTVRWMAAYTLAALALLYTIYWGGFILIAHGLHVLIVHRRRLPRFALVVMIIAAGYLPWLPSMLDQARGGSHGLGDSGGFLYAEPLNRDGLDVIAFQLFGVPEALFFGLAAAGLAGTYAAARRRDYLPTPQTALDGLWLAVPVLLPMIIHAAGFKLLTYRPMIGLVPALALLIGHTLNEMPRWAFRLLLGIILLNNLTTTGATRTSNGPWWAVADLLRENASPADALVIESDLHAYTIEEHARIANVPVRESIRATQIRLGWANETSEPVIDRLARQNSVWLVEFLNEYDGRPDLTALGFVQTTPKIDFGDFINHPVQAARFARPPADPLPWTFGAAMQLAEVDQFVDDGGLHVNLTWQALAPPDVDYSVLVFLLAPDGGVIVQHDSYPLNGRSPTSTWTTGGLYFDRHNLPTDDLPPGAYDLGVRVYTWWDLVIQPVTPCEAETCEHVIVDTVVIP
ncbi:MAG: glycosyltransferase family 39 protein [Anaerolineae bacterium]|nr:glycosyltransferase family 39 protein [Anaerolineae bacterium]